MNSALYTGTVKHVRTRPVRNEFTYGLYYVYVDLAELEVLDSSLKRFGHNRRALVSVWDEDHGGRDGTDLREWIDGVLARAGIDLAGGRVCLLTFPRVMGFKFYPVSFWYCFDSKGTLLAVLAEVQNTYRDHHNYLLHNNGEPLRRSDRPTKAKAFFVSPFVQLDNAHYQFSLSEPAEKLSAAIYDFVDGPLLLTAAISLRAEPLDDASLLRAVLRMGPMSLRAQILIHWQALRLVFKGVRFYPHTKPPEEEITL